MKGYKIRYGEYGHDCWGASEWFGWYEYDNKVYKSCEKCQEAINRAKVKYPDRTFEMYEIEIDD